MSSNRRRPGRAVRVLAVLGLAGVIPAGASSLALDPVRLSLNARQSIGMLTVRNDGDDPTVVQLDTAQWTQVDGKDVYTSTNEILATPPIFTISPHGSQLVRVGVRRRPDGGRELSYRLFLQEVPPPPTADLNGLRVAVRFGIPVFVAPAAAGDRQAIPAAAPLRWQANSDATGGLVLTVANSGGVHAQLSELSIAIAGSGGPVARHGSPEYVLPGQSRQMSIQLERPLAAGTQLQIRAMTGTTPVEANVVLDGS